MASGVSEDMQAAIDLADPKTLNLLRWEGSVFLLWMLLLGGERFQI